MKGKILDGKKIAEEIKTELKKEVEALRKEGVIPGLAVILVGDNPASVVYVRNKKKAAEDLGLYSEIYNLEKDITQKELIDLIDKLNADKNIHGILVQLPLPGSLDEKEVIERIDARKDVDCFHPFNFGKVAIGEGDFLPCTPAGVMEMMKRSGIEVSGTNAVVVGRSNIVGKPMAAMLLREDATISVCHSRTKDLAGYTQKADILVVAVGRPGLITKDMVKEGAVVIDVGMNKVDGKLKGDVDFENVKEKAGYITPVPGGVGPMTIAMLIRNTIMAAKAR